METTGTIALSQMAAMQRQMDIIASNIANANTTAFKGERMMFIEFLQSGEEERFSYVQDYGTLRDLTVGSLTQTDNPLDIAINGEGYFQVKTAQGVRFTRSGHFRLDESGAIVTSDGDAVLGDGGQPLLAAGSGDIAVSTAGAVSVDGAKIGTLGVVTFDDEQALRKVVGGLYATDQQPQPVADVNLVQGVLENSNVEPIVQMTQMIELLRGYQNAQRLIVDDHEAKRRAIQVIAGTPS